MWLFLSEASTIHTAKAAQAAKPALGRGLHKACTIHTAKPPQAFTLWTNVPALGRFLHLPRHHKLSLDGCACSGKRPTHCQASTTSQPMEKCGCSGKRPAPCRLRSHVKLSPDDLADLLLALLAQYKCLEGGCMNGFGFVDGVNTKMIVFWPLSP